LRIRTGAKCCTVRSCWFQHGSQVSDDTRRDSGHDHLAYLFFWQSNQVVEEEIAIGRKRLWQRKGASDEELKYAALDVNTGMLLSNVVMYFIILPRRPPVQAGQTDITSAADAAEALRPVAGDAATVLLAVGLIGAAFWRCPF